MIDSIELRLKDKIFIVLAIAGLLLAFYLRLFNSEQKVIGENWNILSNFSDNLNDSEELSLKIGENIFQVEVAYGDEKKYQGLSERSSLGENQGMLFIFPDQGQYSFVMRDMKFDLDFIFIKDDEVVEVIKNIPSDFRGSLSGKSFYESVIEVPAGWTDEHHVVAGERVYAKKNRID